MEEGNIMEEDKTKGKIVDKALDLKETEAKILLEEVKDTPIKFPMTFEPHCAFGCIMHPDSLHCMFCHRQMLYYSS
jgi:hypothetical protein